MRVAVDTNALMMPVECDVRLFDELDRVVGSYEAVVPEAVVAELEKLADGNGKAATAASVGRDLADRCTVVSTEADYADDAMVELGADCDYAVTNDKPLRRRLADADVPVICLRGGTKLAVTQ
ncbi:PIN domain-containing protein [Halosegnis marinus]|uniref:PIN domain-containing protein n=1 Tax=Halosegnis marinus TaxID=3034023 RepID=A0ABD5ZPS8_9EURY|nr:twitching motility protein PilT [Halosegnis sp. DT85]